MEMGYSAVKHGFKRIFTFGEYSPYVRQGALNAGLDENNILVNTDMSAPQDTAKQILSSCAKGELILIKASHAVHAERIIEFLLSAKQE